MAMGKWKLYLPILACFVCLLGALGYGIDLLLAQARAVPMEELEFWDKAHKFSLSPYYDETEDTYFLFLPACTAPSDLTVTNPVTLRSVPFDLKEAADPNSPASVGQLVLTQGGETYALSLWQCDQLPSLFLSGEGDMLEQVHETKLNKVSAQATILDAQGNTTLQKYATLSGRGHGTWDGSDGVGQSKRPYNLSFSSPISYGPYQEVSTLCLLADFSDESKLRNSLGYYTGYTLGLSYASPYTYINLFVNGEYLGLYGIVTKQEYTNHIVKDQISAVLERVGSYFGPDSIYSTVLAQPMRLYYGDGGYLQDTISTMEEALTTQDWAQCEALIDLDSFALMYAFEEFICNFDMAGPSQYYYLDGEDVLHTMLPWDFDLSMGNIVPVFSGNQIHSMMVYRDYWGDCWYSLLLNWDGFRQRVINTIETRFTDEFLEELSSHMLQDIENITHSRDCDIRRWKTSPSFSGKVPTHDPASLSHYYDLFTDYFPRRREFLLDYFRNPQDYCLVTTRSAEGYWRNTLCVPRGSLTADYLDPANRVTDTGVPLSEIETITQDLNIYPAS